MNHHYWQSFVLGGIATLFVSMSSAHFNDSNQVLMYMNSVINERYVYSYFTLFFGFTAIFFGVLALKYRDSRRRLSVLLFSLSASPLIWGGISWQMELFEAHSVYNGQMSLNPSNKQIADIKWMHILAIQFAFDSMVLAIAVSIVAFSVSLLHWVMCGGVEQTGMATNLRPQISIFIPWLLYFLIAIILSSGMSIFVNIIISVFVGVFDYPKGAILIISRIICVLIACIIVSYSVYKLVFERIIYSRMTLMRKNQFW